MVKRISGMVKDSLIREMRGCESSSATERVERRIFKCFRYAERMSEERLVKRVDLANVASNRGEGTLRED